MLMVTPAALLRLRSEIRAPVSLAPVRPARTKKLSKARREAIVELLARLMRRAVPTPFRLEAPARAAIRSRLCMAGWTWGQADAAADEAVQTALARVGAKRPTWKEGQPEYTQDGHIPQTRERCARCAKPLPDDDDSIWRKFCGPVCAQAAKVDRNRQRDKEELYAKEKIYRAACAEKQPARECPACGQSFQPKREYTKYCSHKCFHDARRFARRKMRMVCEAV